VASKKTEKGKEERAASNLEEIGDSSSDEMMKSQQTGRGSEEASLSPLLSSSLSLFLSNPI
jgi:hypothetical protein